MKVATARKLAYLVQFCLGVAFGLYVLTYLLDLGTAAHRSTPLLQHFDPRVIGLFALIFCFALEYLLNLYTGAFGQLREKASFVLSFALRGSFFVLLAVTTRVLGQSPWLVLPAVLMTMSSFALAFTLFQGNWMAWLQRQAHDYDADENRRFLWNDVWRYVGATIGASIAVLLPYAPAVPHYLLGGSICYMTALFCYILPTRPDSSERVPRTSGGQQPMRWHIPGALVRSRQLRIQMRDMIRKARQELSGLLILNRTLLAASWVYGTYIMIEAVVPMVYLSKFPRATERSWNERLLVLGILVGCQFLPALLGALSVLLAPGVTTLNHLRHMTAGLGLVFGLLAATSFLNGHPIEHWLAGCAIFLARFTQARLLPQYASFNSRIATRPGRESNILLAVGERRNTISALLVLSFAAACKYIVESVYVFYWAAAATAVILACFAILFLRRPDMVTAVDASGRANPE